jgi:ribose transport system substrate-binding protein
MRVAAKFTTMVAAVALSTATLAACGDDSSSSSDDKAASSGDQAQYADAVAASEASVEKYAAAQPPVEVPALSAPAKPGLKLAVLTCAFPVCQASTDPAVEAAKKLGWDVFDSTYDFTPDGYVAGWTAVLQQNPEAVIYVAGFPQDVAKDQLAEAQSRGIPLVAASYNAPSLADSGAEYAVAGAPELAQSGSLMGDAIVADAGGPTDVLFVWDPTLTNTLTPVKNAMNDSVEKAGVKVQTLEVSLSGIGKEIPGQVTNYLQRNPDIKYIAMALSDLGAGVPQALAAVGLADKVKIISRAPQGADLEQIKSGDQWASVAEEVAASGYRAVDDVARLVNGEDVLDPDPAGWHQIMTKDNITQTSGPEPTPGVPDAFYAAWGVE